MTLCSSTRPCSTPRATTRPPTSTAWPTCLQINSPLGKTLESIDHERMCNAVFPALLKMKADGASPQEIDNSITATADGYAFPINLDRDQPIGGLTPDCQADLLRRAVDEAWSADALRAELRAYAYRRLSVGDLPA